MAEQQSSVQISGQIKRDLDAGLKAGGFDLCAFFRVGTLLASDRETGSGSAVKHLDSRLAKSLEQSLEQLPCIGSVPTHDQTLMLVGNGGGRFWQVAQLDSAIDEDDPIDSCSAEQVSRTLTACAPGMESAMLYPGGTVSVPLQVLGQLAGWHHGSPLGIGIHGHYGLWFAYRALVLLDARLTPDADDSLSCSVSSKGSSPQSSTKAVRSGRSVSPCETCSARPCITACPGGAVSVSNRPDMAACEAYRLSAASQCTYRCKARQACPAGSEFRYSRPLEHHVYRASLKSLYRRSGLDWAKAPDTTVEKP